MKAVEEGVTLIILTWECFKQSIAQGWGAYEEHYVNTSTQIEEKTKEKRIKYDENEQTA